MATATERKFTSLRKRLDQLGYRQPLVVESIPLAEKLFGDLLHTTESLKNAKLQLGKHREQKAVWEAHVEPYREDNARLVGESSELHQQLIRLKEGAEARERDLRGRLRRLDHENADLKFLNTQYVQRLRAQEREAQAKADKILELQEKNFQAVIQTPGGRKKQIPLRRQRMELDHVLPANSAPRSATPLPGAGADPPDPYIADLLQLADQRMAELQSRAEAGASERGRLERALQGLRKQVENREAEIGRLNALLSGGRPPEALAAAGAQEGGEKMVAHLNIQVRASVVELQACSLLHSLPASLQVDFLQQANQELEGRLASALTAKEELEGRTAELGGKNARICSELEEIGALVKQMEAERRSGEEGLRERIGQLEVRGQGRVWRCGVTACPAPLSRSAIGLWRLKAHWRSVCVGWRERGRNFVRTTSVWPRCCLPQTWRLGVRLRRWSGCPRRRHFCSDSYDSPVSPLFCVHIVGVV